MIGTLAQSLHNPNVQAFLRVIRAGESSQGDIAYRMLFGGGTFTSFDRHPNIKVSSGNLTSTAAGAYQFLYRTWSEVSEALMLPDFSPPMQDLAAVYLIQRRHALDDVEAGRIEHAIEKCNKEWASLPGSPYGQPTRTMAHALATYKEYGGRLENEPTQEPIQTIPAGEVLPEQPSKPMAPFIPLAFDAIAAVVPALIQRFGTGSEVAQKNAKVAQAVVEAAKTAANAVNEQDLADKLKNDPGAVQAVQQAVKDIWFEITFDTSGVEGARKANAEAAAGPSFWHNPAFLITLLLIAMPMMLLADVFYVHPQSYVGELRTQIVTALLAVIGMVGGYWIGTSFSSARKTEIASKG